MTNLNYNRVPKVETRQDIKQYIQSAFSDDNEVFLLPFEFDEKTPITSTIGGSLVQAKYDIAPTVNSEAIKVIKRFQILAKGLWGSKIESKIHNIRNYKSDGLFEILKRYYYMTTFEVNTAWSNLIFVLSDKMISGTIVREGLPMLKLVFVDYLKPNEVMKIGKLARKYGVKNENAVLEPDIYAELFSILREARLQVEKQTKQQLDNLNIWYSTNPLDILTMSDTEFFNSCYSFGSEYGKAITAALSNPNMFIAFEPNLEKPIMYDVKNECYICEKKQRVLITISEDKEVIFMGEAQPKTSPAFKELVQKQVCQWYSIDKPVNMGHKPDFVYIYGCDLYTDYYYSEKIEYGFPEEIWANSYFMMNEGSGYESELCMGIPDGTVVEVIRG